MLGKMIVDSIIHEASEKNNKIYKKIGKESKKIHAFSAASLTFIFECQKFFSVSELIVFLLGSLSAAQMPFLFVLL